MDLTTRLTELEEMVRDAKSMPLSSSALLNRDEVLDLIEERWKRAGLRGPRQPLRIRSIDERLEIGVELLFARNQSKRHRREKCSRSVYAVVTPPLHGRAYDLLIKCR